MQVGYDFALVVVNASLSEHFVTDVSWLYPALSSETSIDGFESPKYLQRWFASCFVLECDLCVLESVPEFLVVSASVNQ